MNQLIAILRGLSAAVQPYFDRIGLQIGAKGVIESLIASLIVVVLARFVHAHTRLTADEKARIKEYLKFQIESLRTVCEFNFDPEKDYVDNGKKLISHQMPREYTRHLLGWGFLPRRKLRLAQMVRIASQKTGGGNVCALVGEPASGKTVEMVKIFSELARHWKPGRPLPVLIFVNSFSVARLDSILHGHRLQDIAVQYLQESPGLDLKVSPAFVALLEDKWAKLRPVLLFDAVDEISDKKRHEDMVDLLSQGATQLHKTGTVVLSCREADYSGRGNFVVFRMLPLTQRQILAHYHKRGIPYRRALARGLAGPRIEHLAQYLTNVYFLCLYLDWLGSESPQDVQPPADIGDLFEKMFLRDLSKPQTRRRNAERSGRLPAVDASAGTYLQEALAPIALVFAETALPAPTPEPRGKARGPADPGIPLSARPLLRAIGEEPRDVALLQGWRQALWAYVEAVEDPAEETKCLAALSRAVASDALFDEFLRDVHPHARWTAGEIAVRLTDWAARWGCVLPPERKELESGLAEIAAGADLPARRTFVVFQLALSLRAVGWAVAAGILRVDLATANLLRFRHQRIREYLAARQIVARSEEEFLAQAQVDNSWWQQTLNMLAAVSPAPDRMIDQILGPVSEEKGGGPEPWRVLIAAQCLQFLPVESRPRCEGQIGRVTGALLELALGHRKATAVDQVLAVAEVGPLVSCGLIPSTPSLVPLMARLARATGTRSRGVGALIALLRAAPVSLRVLFVGLPTVAYTLMFQDPDEPARLFGRREPIAVRSGLWLLERLGWLVRGLPLLLWTVGLLYFVARAAWDPLRMWRSPQFYLAGLLLLALVLDRTYLTGNWAYSSFRLLSFPVVLALRTGRPILRFGRVALRQVQRSGAQLFRGVGRAILWTSSAVVWSARSAVAGLRALRDRLTSRLRRLPTDAVRVVGDGPAVGSAPDAAGRAQKTGRRLSPESSPPRQAPPEVEEASLRERFLVSAKNLARSLRSWPTRARVSVHVTASWLLRQRRALGLLCSAAVALYGVFLVLPRLTSEYQQFRTAWRVRVLHGTIRKGLEKAAGVESRSRRFARRLDELETSLQLHASAKPEQMLELLDSPAYEELQGERAQIQADLNTVQELRSEAERHRAALPQPPEKVPQGELLTALTSAEERASEGFHRVEPRAAAVLALERALAQYLEIRRQCYQIRRESARDAIEVSGLSPQREAAVKKLEQRLVELRVEADRLAGAAGRWSGDYGHGEVPKAAQGPVASWSADLETRSQAAQHEVERLGSMLMAKRAQMQAPAPPPPEGKTEAGLPVAVREFELQELAPLEAAVSRFTGEAGELARATSASDPSSAWSFLVRREELAETLAKLEAEAGELADRCETLPERQKSLLPTLAELVTMPNWRRELGQRSGSLRRKLTAGRRDLLQASENLHLPAPRLWPLAEVAGHQKLDGIRTALAAAAAGPARLRNLAGRFAELAEAAGLLERLGRELDTDSLMSWWSTGTRLNEKLSILNAEVKNLTLEAAETGGAGERELSEIAARAQELREQCRRLTATLSAEPALEKEPKVDPGRPSPLRFEDFALQGLQVADQVAELRRNLATEMAKESSSRSKAESRIKTASGRVQAAARNARRIVAFYLGSGLGIGTGVGLYGRSLLRARRIHKIISGVESKMGLQEKRDYLLAATESEKLMAVREVAMSGVGDLALATQPDFDAILEASGRLANGSGTDRVCSERLVSLAADVKMRIQRGIRSPDTPGEEKDKDKDENTRR